MRGEKKIAKLLRETSRGGGFHPLPPVLLGLMLGLVMEQWLSNHLLPVPTEDYAEPVRLILPANKHYATTIWCPHGLTDRHILWEALRHGDRLSL